MAIPLFPFKAISSQKIKRVQEQHSKYLLSPPKPIAYAIAASVALTPLVPAESAQFSTAIPVTASVVANVKMHVSYHATELKITESDIERGYIEVPSALRFVVATNSRVGFIMEFRPVGNIIESVKVGGLGNEIHLGADGGAIVQRGALPKNLEHNLSFRFTLRPDVSPGMYPLPIDLTVRALI
jgi:hypothetical protein